MNKCLSPQGTIWPTSLFLLEKQNVTDSVKNINFEAHADWWTWITQHYLLPSSNTTFNEGKIVKNIIIVHLNGTGIGTGKFLTIPNPTCEDPYTVIYVEFWHCQPLN